MFLPRKTNQFFFRIIAFFLVITLTWTQTSFSAPELSSLVQSKPPFDLSTFELPKDLGRIDEIFIPKNGNGLLASGIPNNLIVYIQDAHANLDAQQNIQKIIRLLSEKLDIHTILTEGASGESDLSKIRAFPDQKIKELTTQFWLREVILTGMEAEAVISRKPYRLLGIEDQALYDRNAKDFVGALDFGKEALPAVQKLLKKNLDERESIGNLELKTFEKKVSTYESRGELIQLVSYLFNAGRDHGVKRADLVHIEDLISLILLERSMEGKKEQEASEKAEFQKLSGKIGARELFDEIDLLKERIREKLFLNKKERALFKEGQFLKNAETLISLQATPKDLNFYEANKKEIQKLAKGLAPAINLAEQFYQTSKKREGAFFENVKQIAKNRRPVPNRLFLVTGGFHTDDMTERFRKENIPFVVISPNVSPETNFDRYYERMRGEKPTVEKFESKFREFIKSSAILFQPEVFNPKFSETALQFFNSAREVIGNQKNTSRENAIAGNRSELKTFGDWFWAMVGSVGILYFILHFVLLRVFARMNHSIEKKLEEIDKITDEGQKEIRRDMDWMLSYAQGKISGEFINHDPANSVLYGQTLLDLDAQETEIAKRENQTRQDFAHAQNDLLLIKPFWAFRFFRIAQLIHKFVRLNQALNELKKIKLSIFAHSDKMMAAVAVLPPEDDERSELRNSLLAIDLSNLRPLFYAGIVVLALVIFLAFRRNIQYLKLRWFFYRRGFRQTTNDDLKNGPNKDRDLKKMIASNVIPEGVFRRLERLRNKVRLGESQIYGASIFIYDRIIVSFYQGEILRWTISEIAEDFQRWNPTILRDIEDQEHTISEAEKNQGVIIVNSGEIRRRNLSMKNALKDLENPEFVRSILESLLEDKTEFPGIQKRVDESDPDNWEKWVYWYDPATDPAARSELRSERPEGKVEQFPLAEHEPFYAAFLHAGFKLIKQIGAGRFAKAFTFEIPDPKSFHISDLVGWATVKGLKGFFMLFPSNIPMILRIAPRGHIEDPEVIIHESQELSIHPAVASLVWAGHVGAFTFHMSERVGPEHGVRLDHLLLPENEETYIDLYQKNPKQLIFAGAKLIGALSEFESEGLPHGDLVGNVMVDDKGNIKVLRDRLEGHPDMLPETNDLPERPMRTLFNMPLSEYRKLSPFEKVVLDRKHTAVALIQLFARADITNLKQAYEHGQPLKQRLDRNDKLRLGQIFPERMRDRLRQFITNLYFDRYRSIEDIKKAYRDVFKRRWKVDFNLLEQYSSFVQMFVGHSKDFSTDQKRNRPLDVEQDINFDKFARVWNPKISVQFEPDKNGSLRVFVQIADRTFLLISEDQAGGKQIFEIANDKKIALDEKDPLLNLFFGTLLASLIPKLFPKVHVEKMEGGLFQIGVENEAIGEKMESEFSVAYGEGGTSLIGVSIGSETHYLRREDFELKSEDTGEDSTPQFAEAGAGFSAVLLSKLLDPKIRAEIEGTLRSRGSSASDVIDAIKEIKRREPHSVHALVLFSKIMRSRVGESHFPSVLNPFYRSRSELRSDADSVLDTTKYFKGAERAKIKLILDELQQFHNRFKRNLKQNVRRKAAKQSVDVLTEAEWINDAESIFENFLNHPAEAHEEIRNEQNLEYLKTFVFLEKSLIKADIAKEIVFKVALELIRELKKNGLDQNPNRFARTLVNRIKQIGFKMRIGEASNRTFKDASDDLEYHQYVFENIQLLTTSAQEMFGDSFDKIVEEEIMGVIELFEKVLLIQHRYLKTRHIFLQKLAHQKPSILTYAALRQFEHGLANSRSELRSGGEEIVEFVSGEGTRERAQAKEKRAVDRFRNRALKHMRELQAEPYIGFIRQIRKAFQTHEKDLTLEEINEIKNWLLKYDTEFNANNTEAGTVPKNGDSSQITQISTAQPIPAAPKIDEASVAQENPPANNEGQAAQSDIVVPNTTTQERVLVDPAPAVPAPHFDLEKFEDEFFKKVAAYERQNGPVTAETKLKILRDRYTHGVQRAIALEPREVWDFRKEKWGEQIREFTNREISKIWDLIPGSEHEKSQLQQELLALVVQLHVAVRFRGDPGKEKLEVMGFVKEPVTFKPKYYAHNGKEIPPYLQLAMLSTPTQSLEDGKDFFLPLAADKTEPAKEVKDENKILPLLEAARRYGPLTWVTDESLAVFAKNGKTKEPDDAPKTKGPIPWLRTPDQMRQDFLTVLDEIKGLDDDHKNTIMKGLEPHLMGLGKATYFHVTEILQDAQSKAEKIIVTYEQGVSYFTDPELSLGRHYYITWYGFAEWLRNRRYLSNEKYKQMVGDFYVPPQEEAAEKSGTVPKIGDSPQTPEPWSVRMQRIIRKIRSSDIKGKRELLIQDDLQDIQDWLSRILAHPGVPTVNLVRTFFKQMSMLLEEDESIEAKLFVSGADKNLLFNFKALTAYAEKQFSVFGARIHDWEISFLEYVITELPEEELMQERTPDEIAAFRSALWSKHPNLGPIDKELFQKLADFLSTPEFRDNKEALKMVQQLRFGKDSNVWLKLPWWKRAWNFDPDDPYQLYRRNFRFYEDKLPTTLENVAKLLTGKDLLDPKIKAVVDYVESQKPETSNQKPEERSELRSAKNADAFSSATQGTFQWQGLPQTEGLLQLKDPVSNLPYLFASYLFLGISSSIDFGKIKNAISERNNITIANLILAAMSSSVNNLLANPATESAVTKFSIVFPNSNLLNGVNISGVSFIGILIAHKLILVNIIITKNEHKETTTNFRSELRSAHERPHTKAVVFGLDGTLVDTTEIQEKAFGKLHYWIVDGKSDEPAPDALLPGIDFRRGTIGQFASEQIQNMIDRSSEKELLDARANKIATRYRIKTREFKSYPIYSKFLKIYETVLLNLVEESKVELLPGAEQFLHYLHQNHIAVFVITGTVDRFARKLLQKAGVFSDLAGIYGAPIRQGQKIKYGKEFYIRQIIEKLGFKPESMIVFGDDPRDRKSAKSVSPEIKTVTIVNEKTSAEELLEIRQSKGQAAISSLSEWWYWLELFGLSKPVTQSVQVEFGKKFSFSTDGLPESNFPDSVDFKVSRVEGNPRQVRIQVEQDEAPSSNFAIIKSDRYLKWKRSDLTPLFEDFRQTGFKIETEKRQSWFVVRKHGNQVELLGQVIFDPSENPQAETHAHFTIISVPDVQIFPSTENETALTYRDSLAKLSDLFQTSGHFKELPPEFFSRMKNSVRDPDGMREMAEYVQGHSDWLKIIQTGSAGFIRAKERATQYSRAVIKRSFIWYLQQLYQKLEKLNPASAEQVYSVIDQIWKTYFEIHMEAAESYLDHHGEGDNVDLMIEIERNLYTAGRYLDRRKRYRQELKRKGYVFQKPEDKLAENWSRLLKHIRALEKKDVQSEKHILKRLARSARENRRYHYDESSREKGAFGFEIKLKEIGYTFANHEPSKSYLTRLFSMINYKLRRQLGGAHQVSVAVLFAVLGIGSRGIFFQNRLYSKMRQNAKREEILNIFSNEVRADGRTDENGNFVEETDEQGQPVFENVLRFVKTGQIDKKGNPIMKAIQVPDRVNFRRTGGHPPGSNLYEASIFLDTLLKIENKFFELVQDLAPSDPNYERSTERYVPREHLSYDDRAGIVLDEYEHLVSLEMPKGKEKFRPFSKKDPRILLLLLYLSEALYGAENGLHEAIQHLLLNDVFGEELRAKGEITQEFIEHLFATDEWLAYRLRDIPRRILYDTFYEAGFIQKRLPHIFEQIDPAIEANGEENTPVIMVDSDFAGEMDEELKGKAAIVNRPGKFRARSEGIFAYDRVEDILTQLHDGEYMLTRVSKTKQMRFAQVLQGFMDDVQKKQGDLQKRHYEIAAKREGIAAVEIHSELGQILFERLETEAQAELTEEERRQLSIPNGNTPEIRRIRRKYNKIFSLYKHLFAEIMPILFEGTTKKFKPNISVSPEGFPFPVRDKEMQAAFDRHPKLPFIVSEQFTNLHTTPGDKKPRIRLVLPEKAKELYGGIETIRVEGWGDFIVEYRQWIDQARMKAPMDRLRREKQANEERTGIYLDIGVASDQFEMIPADEFRKAILGTFFMSFSTALRGWGEGASKIDPHKIYDDLLVLRLADKQKDFIKKVTKAYTQKLLEIDRTRAELRMSWSWFKDEYFLKGDRNRRRDVFQGTVFNFEIEDFDRAAYSLKSHWDTDEEIRDAVESEAHRFKVYIDAIINKAQGENPELYRVLKDARRKTLRDIRNNKHAADFTFPQLRREKLNKEQVEKEIEFFNSVLNARIADYEARILEFSSKTAKEAQALRDFSQMLRMIGQMIVPLIKSDERKTEYVLIDYLDPEASKKLKEAGKEIPPLVLFLDRHREELAKVKDLDPEKARENVMAKENLESVMNYILASLRHARRFEESNQRKTELKIAKQTSLLSEAFGEFFARSGQDTALPELATGFSLPMILNSLYEDAKKRIEGNHLHAEVALQQAAQVPYQKIDSRIKELEKDAERKQEFESMKQLKEKLETIIVKVHSRVRRKIAPQAAFAKEKNLVVLASQMSTLYFIDLAKAYPNLRAVGTWSGSPSEHWVGVAAASGMVTITRLRQFEDLKLKKILQEPPQIKSGGKVYVNGEKGLFVANAREETVREFEEQSINEETLHRLSLDLAKKQVTALRDKITPVSIKIGGVAGKIEDIVGVGEAKKGSQERRIPLEDVTESVRLWRSEYIPIPKKDGQYDFDQYEANWENYLIRAARQMPDGVVMRLMDLSADKEKMVGISAKHYGLAFYGTDLGKKLIPAQIRAAIKAQIKSWEERAGQIYIMIPMVETDEEIKMVFDMYDQEMKPFIESGRMPRNKRGVPIGFMIEKVKAANRLPEILDKWEPDFLSIGSNDYRMDFFQTERASGHRANSKLDPELLTEFETKIVRPAVERERPIPVSTCGDMASWRRYQIFWVDLADRLQDEGYQPELSLAVEASDVAHAKHFLRYVKSEHTKSMEIAFAEYEDQLRNVQTDLQKDMLKDQFDEAIENLRDDIEKEIQESDEFKAMREQVIEDRREREQIDDLSHRAELRSPDKTKRRKLIRSVRDLESEGYEYVVHKKYGTGRVLKTHINRTRGDRESYADIKFISNSGEFTYEKRIDVVSFRLGDLKSAPDREKNEYEARYREIGRNRKPVGATGKVQEKPEVYPEPLKLLIGKALLKNDQRDILNRFPNGLVLHKWWDNRESLLERGGHPPNQELFKRIASDLLSNIQERESGIIEFRTATNLEKILIIGLVSVLTRVRFYLEHSLEQFRGNLQVYALKVIQDSFDETGYLREEAKERARERAMKSGYFAKVPPDELKQAIERALPNIEVILQKFLKDSASVQVRLDFDSFDEPDNSVRAELRGSKQNKIDINQSARESLKPEAKRAELRNLKVSSSNLSSVLDAKVSRAALSASDLTMVAERAVGPKASPSKLAKRAELRNSNLPVLSFEADEYRIHVEPFLKKLERIIKGKTNYIGKTREALEEIDALAPETAGKIKILLETAIRDQVNKIGNPEFYMKEKYYQSALVEFEKILNLKKPVPAEQIILDAIYWLRIERDLKGEQPTDRAIAAQAGHDVSQATVAHYRETSFAIQNAIEGTPADREHRSKTRPAQGALRIESAAFVILQEAREKLTVRDLFDKLTSLPIDDFKYITHTTFSTVVSKSERIRLHEKLQLHSHSAGRSASSFNESINGGSPAINSKSGEGRAELRNIKVDQPNLSSVLGAKVSRVALSASDLTMVAERTVGPKASPNKLATRAELRSEQNVERIFKLSGNVNHLFLNIENDQPEEVAELFFADDSVFLEFLDFIGFPKLKAEFQSGIYANPRILMFGKGTIADTVGILLSHRDDSRHYLLISLKPNHYDVFRYIEGGLKALRVGKTLKELYPIGSAVSISPFVGYPEFAPHTASDSQAAPLANRITSLVVRREILHSELRAIKPSPKFRQFEFLADRTKAATVGDFIAYVNAVLREYPNGKIEGKDRVFDDELTSLHSEIAALWFMVGIRRDVLKKGIQAVSENLGLFNQAYLNQFNKYDKWVDVRRLLQLLRVEVESDATYLISPDLGIKMRVLEDKSKFELIRSELRNFDSIESILIGSGVQSLAQLAPGAELRKGLVGKERLDTRYQELDTNSEEQINADVNAFDRAGGRTNQVGRALQETPQKLLQPQTQQYFETLIPSFLRINSQEQNVTNRQNSTLNRERRQVESLRIQNVTANHASDVNRNNAQENSSRIFSLPLSESEHGKQASTDMRISKEIFDNNKITGRVIIPLAELEKQPELQKAILDDIRRRPLSGIEIIVIEPTLDGTAADRRIKNMFGNDIFEKQSGHRPRIRLFAREKIGFGHSDEQAYNIAIDKLRGELGLGIRDFTTRIVALGGEEVLKHTRDDVPRLIARAEALLAAELLIQLDDRSVHFDMKEIIDPSAEFMDLLTNSVLMRAEIRRAA